MRVHAEDLTDVDRYIEHHRHFRIEDHEPEYASTMWRIQRFHTVDPSTSMIEIGTGTGWFPILCKIKGLSCDGLEISPQLVEYAKAFGEKYGVRPDIRVGNIEDVRLGENQYDVVVAVSVFEHVQDWRAGITRIYEALRPGGLLYFNSTNKLALRSHEFKMPLYGWLPDRARFALRKAVQGEDIMKLGIDFNQFTYPVLRRHFHQSGFRTVLDLIDLFDPNALRTPTPWKRAFLSAVKRVPAAKHLALAFAPSTTFICIK